MKKDIYIPKSVNVHLGIIPNNDQSSYDLYLINSKNERIRNILITTMGVMGDRKSSTLRYFIEGLDEFTCQKFETMLPDVQEKNNDVFITYYIGADIFDLQIFFSKKILDEINVVALPIINESGYLLQ